MKLKAQRLEIPLPPKADRFNAQDGQFWLDGKPLFLHAGEFHYFRTPSAEWPQRLNLLKNAGFNAVTSYIPWLWHQPEPGVSDLDGSTHPLRDLAGFIDLAAKMGFLFIARPGPYIMAETINEGIPPWVFTQYPQIAVRSFDGRVHNLASYLHPDFLQTVKGWYRAVFAVLAPRQVTRSGNIVLVHLDNEMGMPHWLRNAVDVNPDTLRRFADYLQEAHGERPDERVLLEQLPHSGSLLEDYRRFYRTYLRDYTRWLWDEARANGLEVPPIVNIHGFANGGKTFPIGLSQLALAMAIPGMLSATDVYPLHIGEGNIHELLLVNALTKALQNPEQPLFSLEFQAGGNQDHSGAQTSFYDLHSRLSISCGMRAINHYLFCDGENDALLSPVKRHNWGHPVRQDGSLRPHYGRYPKLSRVLAAYGDALTLARPQTVTTIGVQLDDFMTELNNTATEGATQHLTHQREVILFDFIARGLTLTHRPFEALELSRATLDPDETPTLWVMMEQQCDAPVQAKLLAYVQAGGNLVLVGRLCLADRCHRLCTLLRDALEVTSLSSPEPCARSLIHAFGHRDVPAAFIERYAGDLGEVFATTEDGSAVGFIKTLGRGRVLVLGAAPLERTLAERDILKQMAERVGCPPAFELTEWADVRLSKGDGGSFLFVANYLDDPVATTIAQARTPLFGGHPVSLPARRGVILPLEWSVAPGVHVHYLTAEVTAVADAGARLTLRTDPPEFVAELSLSGYRCAEGMNAERLGEERVSVHGGQGVLVLEKM
jgi:beta-galactosidase